MIDDTNKITFTNSDFKNLTKVDEIIKQDNIKEYFGDKITYLVNEISIFMIRNRDLDEPRMPIRLIEEIRDDYNYRYTGVLEYWISMFMKGRNAETKKYVDIIIKYLFLHGSPMKSLINENNNFEYISFTELNRHLVKSNGVGKNKILNGDKIPHRKTLSRLLNDLVKADMLQTEEKINHSSFERSKPDKTRTTAHYRINSGKIFGCLVADDIYKELDPTISKEELYDNYQKIIDRYIKSLKFSHRIFNTYINLIVELGAIMPELNKCERINPDAIENIQNFMKVSEEFDTEFYSSRDISAANYSFVFAPAGLKMSKQLPLRNIMLRLVEPGVGYKTNMYPTSEKNNNF